MMKNTFKTSITTNESQTTGVDIPMFLGDSGSCFFNTFVICVFLEGKKW